METGDEMYKGFVDRILKCLRKKRDKGEPHPKCTLEEVFEAMESQDRKKYEWYKKPEVVRKEFGKFLENNPKIDYDKERMMFGFNIENGFKDIDHLEEVLYTKRGGVVRGQDLFDFIDKEDVKRMIDNKKFRVLTFEKSKTDKKEVIFSNKFNMFFDEMNLEDESPEELRTLWDESTKEEIRRDDERRRERRLGMLQESKKTATGKRNRRDQDNTDYWINQHIRNDIEDALKQLKKRNTVAGSKEQNKMLGKR